ncbi:peptidase M19 [Pseudolysobacter antarcticus]|uniref:Peptidase M19 n=1 Tax=Pseudolysobacter antarcticus TaxID=2511995 RepID=A0A411HHS9_9GAMM|nr:membrane dipeptidase [Pseudolysobacter antarcticus]QBB70053.1 peptidase M19 [Pseudolysobacter antarcticus]
MHSSDNDRRQFLVTASALATLALLPAAMNGATAASNPAPSWNRYRRAVVIDGLGSPGSIDGLDGHALSGADLLDIKTSGLTAVNVTVSGVGSYANDFENTLKNIAYWDAQIAAHPNALMKIRSATDLTEAKRSARLGLIYGFQDATPFGENLDRFEMFYNLGVRVILYTYNRRNLIGDGCLESGDAGLSQLGRELVERMNEGGMLIDLAHSGRRTTLESIELSKKPVAITHAGCSAVVDLPRNKTDEALRKLADKGGVIGIYLMPYLRNIGQPMAEDVILHIEHALKICGEDHVGIGTDGSIGAVNATQKYKDDLRAEIADRKRRGISAPGERDDAFTFVPDLNTPQRFDTLATLLAKRGHKDARIEKILGGNFARLFGETWLA